MENFCIRLNEMVVWFVCFSNLINVFFSTHSFAKISLNRASLGPIILLQNHGGTSTKLGKIRERVRVFVCSLH